MTTMLDLDPAAVRDAEMRASYVEALSNGEIPWTSLDPAKNLATQRAQAMTDDERYQAGFDDGFNNRGTRGSLYHYEAYSDGWRAGREARF